MENLIKEAVEKSFDLEQKKSDLELTKLEFDLTVKYGKDDDEDDELPLEALNLEVNIKDKEADFEDIKPTVEVKLRNSYFNLKNLEDNVEIETLPLTNLESQLIYTSARVKAGFTNSIEETNARIAVSKQKNKLQKAINDYMISVDEFKNELGK